ncbi:Stp1/IreP family PP2C-type Ser/Thr phosphatase [uncultured Parolsenella sp.]|uniref:Stp1/IreP family PP2C-type Ser/Thr phosphatase n=1 Tax=uncultured Parolsenella sp. TaxID=2083008 RepID=UPI0025FE2C80|nr:Stp1/IreP family PP2C-type Ser/Thr phosphatase [uncultured Parolsenella sp.]
MGADTRLSWAGRTDVGLVRGHNEDSYLVRNPLFGVCDGMGGHAAGEVASAIAVRTIASHAPEHADDMLLGAAIEAANEAVIQGAANGEGKPGMGCTATCCIIEGTKMAIAHVGDSRIYLLRAGTLVRLTHDHSYVEELVDAGEITADEARVHPSRSIITRALGSDPDMYADHFSLDVERGDRIILCSDGLSSMVPDAQIELLSVSSATPIDCTDQLVAAALEAGGHDNVSVIVVDVVSDGREEARRLARRRAVLGWLAVLLGLTVVLSIALGFFIRSSWYIGVGGGRVGIYQGIHSSVFGIPLSTLEESTQVSIADLPESTQHQLSAGIPVASRDDALTTVQAYQTQIEEARAKAQKAADDAQSDSTDGAVGSALGASGPEAAETGADVVTTSAEGGAA